VAAILVTPPTVFARRQGALVVENAVTTAPAASGPLPPIAVHAADVGAEPLRVFPGRMHLRGVRGGLFSGSAESPSVDLALFVAAPAPSPPPSPAPSPSQKVAGSPKQPGAGVIVRFSPLGLVDSQHSQRIAAERIMVQNIRKEAAQAASGAHAAPGAQAASVRKVVLSPSGSVYFATIQVPLGDVRSGQYEGAVLLTREGTALTAQRGGPTPNGPALGQAVVPVTLQVRDAPDWSLLILLGAAVFTLGSEWYRRYRLAEDDRYARAHDMMARVEKDRFLKDTEPQAAGAPFRREFARLLGHATAAQSVANDAAAARSIADAEDLWARWASAPDRWVYLMGFLSERKEALQKEITAKQRDLRTHPNRLLLRLDEAWQKAPKELSLITFEETVASRSAEVWRYQTLSDRLDAVLQTINQLPGDTEPATAGRLELVARAGGAIKQWQDADPGSAETTAALYSTLTAEASEIENQVRAAAISPSPEAAAVGPARSIEIKPTLIPSTLTGRVATARVTRLAYNFAVGTVVLLGTTLIGFRETYLKDDVFGAAGFADYVTVLLWALGGSVAARTTMAVFSAGGLPAPLRRNRDEPGSTSIVTDTPSAAGAAATPIPGSDQNATGTVAANSGGTPTAGTGTTQSGGAGTTGINDDNDDVSSSADGTDAGGGPANGAMGRVPDDEDPAAPAHQGEETRSAVQEVGREVPVHGHREISSVPLPVVVKQQN
jgi:hypothetical protein